MLVLHHGTYKSGKRISVFFSHRVEWLITKCDCHHNSFTFLCLPTCTSHMTSCECPRCTSPLRLNLGVATSSSVYLILLSGHNCYNLIDFWLCEPLTQLSRRNWNLLQSERHAVACECHLMFCKISRAARLYHSEPPSNTHFLTHAG